MEGNVILCPHEKIISKSEADFDTQWRRQMPRDLEDSVATLLPLPNRFVSTEGWRRYDFIIVGGKTMKKTGIVLLMVAALFCALLVCHDPHLRVMHTCAQFFLLYSIFSQNKRDFFRDGPFFCRNFSSREPEKTTNIPRMPGCPPKNPRWGAAIGRRRRKTAPRRPQYQAP